MPSRRTLLQSLAAASVLGPLSRRAEAAGRRDRPSAEPPWALLAPLEAGSAVGLGWSIQDLEPIRRGAAVLVLTSGEGRTARVHICRRDGAPRGVACTTDLDFVLMNDGAGRAPTDEPLGRVLRLLAAQVRAPTPAGLLTHAERLESYRDDHEVLT